MLKHPQIILGIESSCDDSAVALYDMQRGLLGQCIYSQLQTHQPYGGVVPELASRDHLKKILPLIENILAEHQLTVKDLAAIAYTRGPGLIGSLMVGASIAESLGFALDIPVIGVHHLEAHLMATFLEYPQPTYPFLALLVSGGHTQLVQVKKFGNYEIIGQTLDDAAGEAFDKVAKLLGLSYPGGPQIAKLAQQGNPLRFNFPRPMLNQNNFNFSFSGLKTHVLLCYEKHEVDEQLKADIAAAFQEAVVDVLTEKSLKALKALKLKSLVVAGGVSANQQLRLALQTRIANAGYQIYFPKLEFATDNAAMVAITGFYRLAEAAQNYQIDVSARWPLGGSK